MAPAPSAPAQEPSSHAGLQPWCTLARRSIPDEKALDDWASGLARLGPDAAALRRHLAEMQQEIREAAGNVRHCVHLLLPSGGVAGERRLLAEVLGRTQGIRISLIFYDNSYSYFGLVLGRIDADLCK